MIFHPNSALRYRALFGINLTIAPRIHLSSISTVEPSSPSVLQSSASIARHKNNPRSSSMGYLNSHKQFTTTLILQKILLESFILSSLMGHFQQLLIIPPLPNLRPSRSPSSPLPLATHPQIPRSVNPLPPASGREIVAHRHQLPAMSPIQSRDLVLVPTDQGGAVVVDGDGIGRAAAAAGE